MDERAPAAEEPVSETSEALERVLSELREIASDLLALSQLKVARARAGMRAGVFNIGIAGALVVAGVATTIVAAWFLIDGVAGGLGEWLGRAWAGRALAGAGALVAIVSLVSAVRAGDRRANLARLRRSFPEDDDDRA